jgi:site-specific recombinase XerD
MKSTPIVTELLKSWMRSLEAAKKSPATMRAYADAVRSFTNWAIDTGHPTDPAEQTRDDVQDFMIHTFSSGLSSGTAATRFRNLKQWFKWLVAEHEIDASPMDGMAHPTVDEKVPDVITDDDLKALIAVTSGNDFFDRRDRAIIRVLLDTGMRRGELIGLTVADVHLDHRVLVVTHSKTHKGRTVPIGAKATTEIDRYLRQRRRHKAASSPMLWLGQSGPIGGDLVRKMLHKRCDEAGIGRIHPHQFRHTAAHRWLLNGGQEQDLARIAGWTPGSVMLSRYGASAAAERARVAHQTYGAGDSL